MFNKYGFVISECYMFQASKVHSGMALYLRNSISVSDIAFCLYATDFVLNLAKQKAKKREIIEIAKENEE